MSIPEIPGIWLYLIAIIAILIVVFVLYTRGLLSKEDVLKYIDTIIVEDERLIPNVPPEDAEKLKIKNEALRVLKMAIEEGWIPLDAERAMLQAFGIKRLE